MLFLNAYVLNLALLYCTAAMCGRQITFKVPAAAIVGAAISLIEFTTPAFAVVFTAGALALEQICAFGYKGVLPACITALASAAAAYGAWVLIMPLMRNMPAPELAVLPVLSLLFLLIGAAAALVRKMYGRSRKKDKVHISTGRGEITLKLLKDSGNLLREPQGGLPVMVVRAEDAKNIAPLSSLFALGLSDADDNTVIYPVPYKTLGASGVLYGFKPKTCTIGEKRLDCIVALCAGSDKFGGDCSALCNPDILEV